jgi:hypothetical protein
VFSLGRIVVYTETLENGALPIFHESPKKLGEGRTGRYGARTALAKSAPLLINMPHFLNDSVNF